MVILAWPGFSGGPPKCAHILISRTCDCDRVWKQGLCTWDELKDLRMTSSRITRFGVTRGNCRLHLNLAYKPGLDFRNIRGHAKRKEEDCLHQMCFTEREEDPPFPCEHQAVKVVPIHLQMRPLVYRNSKDSKDFCGVQ